MLNSSDEFTYVYRDIRMFQPHKCSCLTTIAMESVSSLPAHDIGHAFSRLKLTLSNRTIHDGIERMSEPAIEEGHSITTRESAD